MLQHYFGIDLLVANSISRLPSYLRGSLTSDDPSVRRQVIDTVKTGLDMAAELGAMGGLWTGRDGYDYVFQIEYDLAWKRLVEGLEEIAAHRPDVKLGNEYKLKEPRRKHIVSSAAKTLVLINEVGASNLGVLLDTGHALLAQENLAEIVTFLSHASKLFHIHLNDCTGLWDDDMIVGSVNFLSLLEMLYWVDRVNYKGWLSFDLAPLENKTEALAESFGFVQLLIKILNRIGREKMKAAIESRQITEMMALLRKDGFMV